MRRLPSSRTALRAIWLAGLLAQPLAWATPANKAALEKHYDRFLVRELARCATCHLPSDNRFPESLEEFPHNPFGDRLRRLGEERIAAGEGKDLVTRLAIIADEDADGDGVANETELLLGHRPGEVRDKPSTEELASAARRAIEFERFLAGYRWRPLEPVARPDIPRSESGVALRNPIDDFLAAEWTARGLGPRPEAGREVLFRRVYLDLIGLNPTPEEQDAFLQDDRPDAYERVVDRLLADPRHSERWARHWMDIWRYSDWAGWTDGNQIRDSRPHIWRWRDWIVESLQADKPYDRMVTEMLAADELAPEDPDALRATGFLVRNYKMLSREQWLEDTVKHTAQAFLGLTMGCAKCHDHVSDPISQRDYYAFRAIFEPHQVRTDRLPGQLDIAKDGIVRAYDATNAPTWFFARGDERQPLTNKVVEPAVPPALGGRLEVQQVTLPWLAANPDYRDFVIRDTIAASETTLAEAGATLARLHSETNSSAAELREAELVLATSERKHAALVAQLELERGAELRSGAPTIRAAQPASDARLAPPSSDAATIATNLVLLQRMVVVAEARLKQHQAQAALTNAQQNADAAARPASDVEAAQDRPRAADADKAAKTLNNAKKALAEADQRLAEAVDMLLKPLDARFKPRVAETYPGTSTGRRLAFARWIANTRNPLTARVAVNHVWLRHFGRGLVPSPADFGRNGLPPTHPQLLDWLAAEFMSPLFEVRRLESAPTEGADPARPWSLRHLHRLIVTSAAYRMASTADESNLAIDPDNHFLWRMNSRRLEAECVRDNLLHAAGALDLAMGGPDIDHKLALKSPRRSLYLRHAAEKQAEFLQIFDGPGVTECYERRTSVMPQQALALANSELALTQARKLAGHLGQERSNHESRFVELAFQRILARRPTPEEFRECHDFLAGAVPISANITGNLGRAAENLILVLFNHNDFVTVR